MLGPHTVQSGMLPLVPLQPVTNTAITDLLKQSAATPMVFFGTEHQLNLAYKYI